MLNKKWIKEKIWEFFSPVVILMSKWVNELVLVGCHNTCIAGEELFFWRTLLQSYFVVKTEIKFKTI